MLSYQVIEEIKIFLVGVGSWDPASGRLHVVQGQQQVVGAKGSWLWRRYCCCCRRARSLCRCRCGGGR